MAQKASTHQNPKRHMPLVSLLFGGGGGGGNGGYAMRHLASSLTTMVRQAARSNRVGRCYLKFSISAYMLFL